MRSESGLTLVETVVTLAIIALMAGMAVFSGSSMIRSAERSQAMSKLTDDLAVARMSAIARSETWRIRFDAPQPPGSTVVRSWIVEYRKPGDSTWTTYGETYTLGDGLGLEVPIEGGLPVTLQFNRFGRFGRGENTYLTVCPIVDGAGGVKQCQQGIALRTIRLQANTGAMGY